VGHDVGGDELVDQVEIALVERLLVQTPHQLFVRLEAHSSAISVAMSCAAAFASLNSIEVFSW
jgi:hypothetical protein